MDDYAREMMDLKTLVTRTLEKKGVLAKIRVYYLSCPFFSFSFLKAIFFFFFPHNLSTEDSLFIHVIFIFKQFCW